MCDKVTIEDIKYIEDPECEHCGVLEPYTAVIEDGTDWCIDCARYNDDVELSEEDEKLIEVVETLHKIKYFQKRYESNQEHIAHLVRGASDSLLKRLEGMPPIGDLD